MTVLPQQIANRIARMWRRARRHKPFQGAHPVWIVERWSNRLGLEPSTLTESVIVLLLRTDVEETAVMLPWPYTAFWEDVLKHFETRRQLEDTHRRQLLEERRR